MATAFFSLEVIDSREKNAFGWFHLIAYCSSEPWPPPSSSTDRAVRRRISRDNEFDLFLVVARSSILGASDRPGAGQTGIEAMRGLADGGEPTA
jgi:hypothetical protein